MISAVVQRNKLNIQQKPELTSPSFTRAINDSVKNRWKVEHVHVVIIYTYTHVSMLMVLRVLIRSSQE